MFCANAGQYRCLSYGRMKKAVSLVQVLVMQTALAGVGPTCRAFFWCSDPNVQRKPLPQELMHSFRDRMCDCMDISPTAPVQVGPPGAYRNFLRFLSFIAS